MDKWINQHNPILPVKYHFPDCEAHVMPDGELYIYGSFDDGQSVYCSNRYYVIHTPDLKEWDISPISLSSDGISWMNDPNAEKYPGAPDFNHPSPFMKVVMKNAVKKIVKDKIASLLGRADKTQKEQPNVPLLFAPDAIHKDGKYYLYFCGEDGSEGVAVAENPMGPFTNPIRIPVGGIDPAIFVDDDGRAYYYWSQIESLAGELEGDMVHLKEDSICKGLVTEAEHYFHEGSSMRKIGDTYYYVYADMERGKPTALGYATSKSPLGPFTYQGIIIDNADCDPASWNNHGSIECVQGQWYIFYHRSTRNTESYRRLCMEPITILPDGTIPEVKMTSQGIGQPFAPGEKLMAYMACGLKGKLYIDEDETYEEVLTNMKHHDEAVFRYVESDTSWSQVQVMCSGTGRIHIYMKKEADAVRTLVGTVNVDGSSTSYTADITGEPGRSELTLEFVKPRHMRLASIVLK